MQSWTLNWILGRSCDVSGKTREIPHVWVSLVLMLASWTWQVFVPGCVRSSHLEESGWRVDENFLYHLRSFSKVLNNFLKLFQSEKLSNQNHRTDSTSCDFNAPGGTSGKEPTCQCRRCKRPGFYPWIRKIPWRREWQPIPVFLPGKSHGQRSLVDYTVHGMAKNWTWLKLPRMHTLCSLEAFIGGSWSESPLCKVTHLSSPGGSCDVGNPGSLSSSHCATCFYWSLHPLIRRISHLASTG